MLQRPDLYKVLLQVRKKVVARAQSAQNTLKLHIADKSFYIVGKMI